MRITVCNGTKSRPEAAPSAFFLAERRLPVVAVLKRWSDSPYDFFEVRVDDGRRFVLRCEPPAGRWELVAVYGPATAMQQRTARRPTVKVKI
jgi:hypothetical protein